MMSKTQRIALASALLLIAIGIFVATKRTPPNPAAEEGSSVIAPVAPRAPADPNAPMKPGEVRPGDKPGTLVVQPFQPGGPKTISSNYRVPSHRDDARITRRDDGAVIFEQAIDLARQLHSDSVEPSEDVQILNAILAYYRLVYGQNPVAGENLEVVAALTGKNEHKIIVFPSDHPDISDSGELLDRWGQPYIFHPLSGTKLDILSLGPDKTRRTPDDLSLGLEPDP